MPLPSKPPLPLSSLFDLKGRAALVTGGAHGLGFEIAEGLAEAGCRVVIFARNAGTLERAAQSLRDAGFDCVGIAGDVTDPASAQAALDATVARCGALDILVNNAGVIWQGAAERMPLDDWQNVIGVNLTGTFLMSQAAAGAMIPRRSGCIINIASIAAFKGVMPGGMDYAAYVASKGGVVALTRELAAKWAPHGIRVNAIAPGLFPSQMTEKALAERGEEAMSRATPMRRIGRAGELKGVAVFLAASASSFITGQTIVVDGGRTAV